MKPNRVSSAELHPLNRADGVRGHYCIGRRMFDGRFEFWQFWHQRCGWCSAGTVYIGVTSARRQIRRLERVEQEKRKKRSNDMATADSSVSLERLRQLIVQEDYDAVCDLLAVAHPGYTALLIVQGSQDRWLKVSDCNIIANKLLARASANWR